MRKFYIVGLAVIACLIIGLAYAEQITFSTYYPAPFGVYREMRTIRHAIGDTYYKAGDHPWDEDGFPVSGEIDQDADLVVEGNVGIGTTNPQEILDVNSSNSGFLPPRMNQTQLNAIETTVTEGSIAYNTDDEQLNYRGSTSWKTMGGSGGGVAIATGTIAHGGNLGTSTYLPTFPDGAQATVAQSKFFVSVGNWDPYQRGTITYIQCSVTSTGAVTCQFYLENLGAQNATANYLIIAQR